MRYFKRWLLIVACMPIGAGAQTARQSHVQSQWDNPDAPRPRGDALLRVEMMRAHNAARAAIGAPPVLWSDTLAKAALGYARELARTGQFRHSARDSRASPQGENLWMGTRGAFAYAEMAASWVDERRYYRPRVFPDISTTGNWADVGHYTQIVWRTTTTIGCAVASNDRDDYLVCRYTPPGNVYGRTVSGQP